MTAITRLAFGSGTFSPAPRCAVRVVTGSRYSVLAYGRCLKTVEWGRNAGPTWACPCDAGAAIRVGVSLKWFAVQWDAVSQPLRA